MINLPGIKKSYLAIGLFDNESESELDAGKAGVDFAEYIADNRSEDHEGRNYDDGYQNKD